MGVERGALSPQGSAANEEDPTFSLFMEAGFNPSPPCPQQVSQERPLWVPHPAWRWPQHLAAFMRGHRGRSVSATQSCLHGDGHGAERGF